MLQKGMIQAMEKGYLPDVLIRYGIRKLCKERLESLKRPSLQEIELEESRYIANLKQGPVAVHTKEANEQHYELPPDFFKLVLGKNRKYSSTYWPSSCRSLDEAEALALDATILRAELSDGMRILELGCGWGSLTLAMGRKFPNSKITALSNSAPQRLFIENEAKIRGLQNIEVLTRNIAEFDGNEKDFGNFDRVVSVEMFEHMKNYELLMQKIAQWLNPGGKLFVHIFTHRLYSYPFETEGEDNWMGRYFFTGGQMPSQKLLSNFQNDLILENQWSWDGTHYGKTSEAWLENMDARRDKILPIFIKTYGENNAKIWFQRWRVFFMSCAELFNFKNGSEWGVTHYLFKRR